jgi:hypothetical protein
MAGLPAEYNPPRSLEPATALLLISSSCAPRSGTRRLGVHRAVEVDPPVFDLEGGPTLGGTVEILEELDLVPRLGPSSILLTVVVLRAGSVSSEDQGVEHAQRIVARPLADDVIRIRRRRRRARRDHARVHRARCRRVDHAALIDLGGVGRNP